MPLKFLKRAAEALLGGVCLYAALLAYQGSHDRLGDEAVSALIKVAEKAKGSSGVYPARLETEAAKVWGFLPGPKVVYRLDGGECDISYYQWPLGPHRGCRCGTNAWYFEE